MHANKHTYAKRQLVFLVVSLAVLIVVLISVIRHKGSLEPQPVPEEPKPVIEELSKCYITENDGETLTILSGDASRSVPLGGYTLSGSGQIADITLTDGTVSGVTVYEQKLNDKLISVKTQADGTYAIELERLGVKQTTGDMQCYSLLGTPTVCQISDLTIGYAFSDFVLNETGKIVAALLVKQEEMEQIRVLLKTDDFAGAMHETVSLHCDTAMDLLTEDGTGELKEVQTLEPGETLQIAADSTLFETANRIYARPQALSAKTTVDSILRNGKTPVYPGNFEIEKTGEGFLLINELALEDYLRFVVPSEMPASYPAEALKAQAVCARTYAYMHMLHAGLQNYGAHVDDSAAFQVYNNIAEASETSEAVYETKGQMLLSGGTPVTAYFYSTSCGYGTDLTAWNLTYGDEMAATGGYLRARNIAKGQMLSDTQNPDAHSSDAQESAEGSKLAEEDSFATFIKTADADSFEQEDTYYRWRYDTALDTELLLANLQVRYEKSPGNIRRKKGNGYVDEKPEKLGMVTGLTAVKRTTGGVMTELLIEGTKDSYLVCGEQNIRYVLAGENTEIALSADYSKKGTINGMLPSSFFVIEPVFEESDVVVPEGKAESETKRDSKRKEEKLVVVSYRMYGGGFGHGIGMSQNAARRMAQAGYDYKQILQFFYECSIEGVNE